MCGRFTLTADPPSLRAELGVEVPEDLVPRYNIAPTQPVLSILAGRSGWKPALLSWGLIPFWSRDRGGAHQRINALLLFVMQLPFVVEELPFTSTAGSEVYTNRLCALRRVRMKLHRCSFKKSPVLFYDANISYISGNSIRHEHDHILNPRQ